VSEVTQGENSEGNRFANGSFRCQCDGGLVTPQGERSFSYRDCVSRSGAFGQWRCAGFASG
jgi:hypothetical protein